MENNDLYFIVTDGHLVEKENVLIYQQFICIHIHSLCWNQVMQKFEVTYMQSLILFSVYKVKNLGVLNFNQIQILVADSTGLRMYKSQKFFAEAKNKVPKKKKSEPFL